MLYRSLFLAGFLAGLALGVQACVIQTGPSGPSTPELTTKNVSTARADIKIWDVEPTSAVRQGSSTSNQSGSVNVEWSNGATTTHDANYKVTSGTLFQDGKVCHNYGPKCYCGTTTFRLESGMTMWKFGTPSNNEPVACPDGIQPTGDAEIRKSLSGEDKEALKAKIRAEHAAGKKRGN